MDGGGGGGGSLRFDTSSGFLGSGEDHFNQRSDGAGCAVDFWKDDGPDRRNGSYDAWCYRDDIGAIFDDRATGVQ